MAVKEKQRRYRLRKPGPSRSRPRATSSRRSTRRKSKSDALPGWNDLTGANRLSGNRAKGSTFLERVSTTRFALLIVGVAVLFTLYVGHVHATQDLLAQVQQERRENLRLHLKHNRLKGEFDRMVGPAVIYERAHELGLVEEPDFGPTIRIQK